MSPNEAVNGSPVCAAKLFERFLCRRRVALRLQHYAPMRGGKCRRAVMIISAERAQRSQVVLSGGHITIEPRSHARFKPVSQWARSVAYFGVFAFAVSENSLKSSDFESADLEMASFAPSLYKAAKMLRVSKSRPRPRSGDRGRCQTSKSKELPPSMRRLLRDEPNAAGKGNRISDTLQVIT